MIKTLCIGAGGINSSFVEYIHTLVINNVQGMEELDMTVVDGDIVELKNLQYQNFKLEDIDKPKAQVIGDRYLFANKTMFIEQEKDLKGYDLIILGVDNGKVRNLVYEFCDKNKDVKFIDLRSEGTACCFYTSHEENSLEKMKETIDVEAPSTSCQLKFELENGIIQQGNKIIASIGSQLLLNELRGVKNRASFIQRF